jgi:hypothetical protein
MTQITKAALLARVEALEKSLEREAGDRKRLEKALAEALDQKTATSEILRVISSSPTDVQPVFDTIVRSAQRLLGARTSSIFRRLGDEIHLAAYTRTGEAADAAFASHFPMSFDHYRKRYPSAELTGWMEPSYTSRISSAIRALLKFRTLPVQGDSGASCRSRCVAGDT